MADLIERQAAINAIENTECELLPEEWNELTNSIMAVPSAQPEKHTEKRTETHERDLISKQAAIDAIENIDWYHQNKKKDMVQGANSAEDQPWYKSQDVYKAIEELPSIQPLTRCKSCEYSVCIKADDRFCSNLEAQKDGSD